jgi:transposase-like protein
MRDSEEKKALMLKAIALLREGMTIGEVCSQCGVADTTLMKWRAQLAPELLSERLRAKYRRIYSEWKASGSPGAVFAAARGISHNTLYVAEAFCEGAAGMPAEENAAKPDPGSEGEVVFYDGPLCAESRGRLRERSVRDGEVRMELAMGGGMLRVSCAPGAAADVVRAVASVMGGAHGR